MARVRAKMAFYAGCEYNLASKELLVMFTVWRKAWTDNPLNGHPYHYRYFDVPVAVAASFLNDNETGEYYNIVIRDHYTFERIG